MCDYEQGLAASERTIAVYVNFMKLGHTWARFVRMRYDILDSNGKANIHSGPDITWNHFGLQRMCLRILTGLGGSGSSIQNFSSGLLFPGSEKYTRLRYILE